MNPAAVSFFVPIPAGAETAVENVLKSAKLKHADASEDSRIHFLSIVLLPADRLNGDDANWLSVEVSIDALEEEATAELCRVPAVKAVLTHVASATGTAIQDEGDVGRWLEAHRLPFRTGLGAAQGLAFNGTPGMSASRIRMEARLIEWVRGRLACAGAAESPLARLRRVRSEAFMGAAWKNALFSEPTQLLEPGRPVRAIALTVLWVAARDYLWLLLLVPALVVWLGIFLLPLAGSEILGGVQVLPLHLAAAAVFAAMVIVDAVRLLRLRLAWFLWAPLAFAVGVLALRFEANLAAALLPSDCWQAISRLIAITGLVFGAALVLRSALRWQVGLVAVAALLAFAAGAVWPGWSSNLPSWALWPGLIVETLVFAVGFPVLLVLNLLLLAAALRTTATRLETKARLAWLVGLSVVVVHLALNPGAVGASLLVFAIVLLLQLPLLAAAAAVGYRRLRDQEEGDRPVDREPDNEAMRSILNHENQPGVVQNHLAAQSIAKPGWHRKALLRLALWVAEQITTARSPAGFLGRIGTIHHARWLMIPKTRRLVFLSNYDGSWQSYLEDFIARLREGLSSLWSNTEGFPRTFRLTTGGASDGSRFKRWARRQQVPSLVWISGYPTLTTTAIRTNAEVRLGLAAAQTEREASRWLVKLGVAAQSELTQDSIPSLVFGGLSPLTYATLLVLRFGQSGNAKTLMRTLQQRVAYGPLSTNGRRAIVIGLSSSGLAKLGMLDETGKRLPLAFVQGMADYNRARMLGDPETLLWGGHGSEDDAVILLYGADQGTLRRMLRAVQRLSDGLGHTLTWEQPLEPSWPHGSQFLPAANGQSVANVLDARDGISQPIIRGLKGSRESQNSIHVVEPGEIVLGYIDNLRKRSAQPSGSGVDDLKNGTFLVVRQLQFDRDKFDGFLKQEAGKMLPQGADAAAQLKQQHWLAGKMLGRWPSGTSLVREPDADPNNGKIENDFLYGREDPAGIRCPLGSHVRRMNPRDSLDPPSSRTQLAITNRHRILRVGRRYRRGQTEGLMFMCLNADIERQFEFLQQTWALSSGFHGLDSEVDPLLGPGGEGFSIPGESGTVRLSSLPRFVQLVGGGYFFLPGKEYLKRLLGDN